MSGLARMLSRRGATLRGSDQSRSELTDELVGEGIAVGFDQERGEIPAEAELVIASAAIKEDHPQVLAARVRGVPVITYAEALGRCMAVSTGVAIAGTHGKSTTTAMLGSALTDAGMDPSVIVGATCRHLSRGTLSGSAGDPSVGVRVGSERVPAGPFRGRSGLLVAEACEFNRSFHNLRPTLASISSVEADHLDIYGSLDAVVESFKRFAELVPAESEGGKLLIAHDGAHRREITAGLSCKVETIGFSPAADWAVSYDLSDRRVRLTHDSRRIAEWTMRLPGAHNAMNAATALALGVSLGASAEVMARSLSEFRGVDRRCQLLGERAVSGGAVRVYDDYGHHPTEVDATLRALREFERPEQRGGRLICVFQPHQHSRTRFFMDEFAQAFGSADVVIVPHIYFARDSHEERTKVTASDLVDRLRERGVQAMHLYPFEAIIDQLQMMCRAGDLLVVMGAGSVWKVGRGYLASGAHGGAER